MGQPQQILGHQPGEGCDFCDALRREKEDDEELDAVIAEEEEEEEQRAGDGEESVYTARTTENYDHDNDGQSESLYPDSDSETYRAIKEESIIKTYLSSSSTTTLVDSVYNPSHEKEDKALKREQAKRASDWARSYSNLVGRQSASQTTLKLQRFPEPDGSRVVEGWF